MISYIFELLGVQYSQGSAEYSLILCVVLNIILACSVALIRWLTAPVDLLSRNKK